MGTENESVARTLTSKDAARRRRTARQRSNEPAASRAAAGVAFQLEPRKLPRQARSRATFNAIVDACGQVLASSSYDALTTNSISERAGVSIGTLYEYFPNREAIVAALAANSCERLFARMEQAIEEAAAMATFEGVEHLLEVGIQALGAQENAFQVLLRDAPFVAQLPAFRQAREALTGLCQSIRMRSADQLNLADPPADTWLISQMLFSAMMEIASLDAPASQVALLRHELAYLTFRMAMGRDAHPSEMGRTSLAAQ